MYTLHAGLNIFVDRRECKNFGYEKSLAAGELPARNRKPEKATVLSIGMEFLWNGRMYTVFRSRGKDSSMEFSRGVTEKYRILLPFTSSLSY